MIVNRQFSILINLESNTSFISSVVLKRVKVNAIKKDEFIQVEMASGAKQKVNHCNINLGDFVRSVNIYATILRYYDIVIEMDWLESHDAILNYKMK